MQLVRSGEAWPGVLPVVVPGCVTWQVAAAWPAVLAQLCLQWPRPLRCPQTPQAAVATAAAVAACLQALAAASMAMRSNCQGWAFQGAPLALWAPRRASGAAVAAAVAVVPAQAALAVVATWQALERVQVPGHLQPAPPGGAGAVAQRHHHRHLWQTPGCSCPHTSLNHS